MSDVTPDGFAVPGGTGLTPKQECPDCHRILKPNGEQAPYAGKQCDIHVCPNCQGQYLEGPIGPIRLNQ